MRNKLLVAGTLALAMTCTTVFSSITPAVVKAASVSTVQTQTAENSDDYVYCYAGLTWAEYWNDEEVMAAGDTTSSDTVDSNDEKDKGAFDAVTRATVKHGLHRGSYQCTAVIKTAEGEYKVSHWSKDGKTVYFTDGTSAEWNGGTLTLTDGTTQTMTEYDVLGLKYVPVKVRSSDYDSFKEKYSVVENNGTLIGGYDENDLKLYKVIASVDKDTNGLKTAKKQSDGSFTFTQRNNKGSSSGIKNQNLKTADLNKLGANVHSAKGSYGEFLRVDFTEGYGDLGANMQAVKWTYYGNDEKRSNALATYGTKFAADNWIHAKKGIQLGLTDSTRCRLPKGYDGTGYWSLTIYALGYHDFTYNFEATDANIAGANIAGDNTKLNELVSSVKGLKKSDYTEKSWNNFEIELNKAKVILAKEAPTQAEINEAVEHLTEALSDLKEKAVTPSKPATPSNPGTTTTKKPATKPALKKANVKLSKPVLKVGKTTKNKAKVTWKKVKKATGYEIQYTTKGFGNKKATKTIKVSKAKITSAQLKKLKKKTRYKVRIRAVYTKAGYQTATSKWSAIKTVKTK